MRCEVYRRQLAARVAQARPLVTPVANQVVTPPPPIQTKVATVPARECASGPQKCGQATQGPRSKPGDRHKDKEGRKAYLRAYMARRRAAARAAKAAEPHQA